MAGNSKPMSTAMIAMTTSNSINVNARRTDVANMPSSGDKVSQDSLSDHGPRRMGKEIRLFSRIAAAVSPAKSIQFVWRDPEIDDTAAGNGIHAEKARALDNV